MMPVSADSPLNSDTKGEATTPAIPVARNTIPPIAVSIAIIVTPKGRFLTFHIIFCFRENRVCWVIIQRDKFFTLHVQQS